ncbi:MAG: tetratricopeptide repeat protein [Chloroflexota bacterium]
MENTAKANQVTRRLVPVFILEKVQQGEQQGQFEAVTLFVDTSGFTPLTAQLTESGRDGAEQLANILHAVFEPLVRAVFAHGGYIAGFAGDGFKAIFPTRDPASYWHALAVAEQIRTHIATHPTHETKYGRFEFSVRASVADGTVTWAIWSAKNDALPQSTVYTFSGTALEQAIEGENHAAGGQIVVTPSVYRTLQQEGLTTATDAPLSAETTAYIQLGPITNALPAPQPIVPTTTPAIEQLARQFYPQSLLAMPTQGEFRAVYSLFVTVQELPSPGAANDFWPTLLALVHQYGGYLCRLSGEGTGGTFLLFWGAPTSHENDLNRALNFLLKLQAACPSPLKAGVTHDLVYAGFLGSPLSDEYTCHGSRVNQAARQAKAAEWGQLLLDEATAQRAQPHFKIALAGQYRLKGLAEEQTLFALERQRVRRVTQPFAANLIGRAGELAQLHQAVEPIFSGQFAGLTLITGDAGIGKSHLLEVFQQQLAEQNVQTIHCQSDEILRESLNPWRYFLRRYFGQSPDESEANNKARFFQQIDSLINRTLNEQLRSELQRTRSMLAALINLRWDDSLYEQLEPQLRFENTQIALKTLILAESLRQPVLLILEDIHWLDEDSRQFLTALMRNVADYPLAIVATTRPIQTGINGGLTAVSITHHLFMRGLDTTEITTLASSHLDGPLTPALIELLTERAEGNPFFAEQLLLYLQEQDLLVVDQDGWRLAHHAEQANLIPTDVQAVLIARLDRLTHEVRQVVQTAAVLGREFSVQILSQMLRDDPLLDDKMLVAQEADVWSALSELRYLFRHTLLRDAAYTMQLTARLRTLHQTAAAAIEQLYGSNLTPFYSDLAYHFDQADNNERAIYYLQLAAQQANDQYRNAEALALLERLLKRLTDPVAIAEARVTQCRLLGFFGRHPEARDLLEETEKLVADLSDKQALIAVQIGIGAVNCRIGDANRALEALTAAEAAATERQDRDALARVYYQLSNTYSVFSLDDQRAIDYGLQAFNLLDGHSTDHQMNRIIFNLGNVYRNVGDFVQGRQFYERSAELSRQLGDDDMLAKCYGSIGIMHALREEFEEAIPAVEQAVVLAQAVGAQVTLSTALSNLAKMRMESGQHRRALPMLERALRMGYEAGEKRRIAIALSNIAEVHEKIGDLPLALTFTEDGVARQEELGDTRRTGLRLSQKARILARMGRFAEAAVAAEQSLTHLANIFSVGSINRHHGWTAYIYAKLGRHEEALQQCLAQLASVAETKVNYVPGLIHLAVALVLIDADQAAQNGGLYPHLTQLAEQTGTANDIATNFAAAIELAEAAQKRELSIMARCEAARYWVSQNETQEAGRLLATAKSLSQAHDLITSANEVEAVCGELGIDFAML